MDLSQFHFLRPLWLLALLPVALVGWRLLRKRHPLGPWAEVFEARFLALFSADTTPRSKAPIWALLALWTLMVLALAGPTVSQKILPAHKVRSATVIVLDLSLSMLARDLPPSRIERARFKLHDLITRHPEMRFGMVAYAGSAHVITPIAEDSATLLNLLPSLNPLIMPRLGSRPDLAMEEAHRLFTGSRIERGHIIWVTDDLDHEEALRRFFKRHDYTLSILAVGTRKGAPIPLPNGQFLKDARGRKIIARLPWQRLEPFAQDVGARLTPLTLGDEDLDWLLPHERIARAADSQQKVVQWQDLGPWLVLLATVAAAFGFRRGWLFALAFVILLPAQPSPALAQEEKTLSDWRDIFRTPDQQAWRQWQQKHYGRACDLFEDPAWKGAACYRAHRYEDARRAFTRDNTARGAYNLGNTLARMGDWQGALRAWRHALQLDPTLKQAERNIRLLEDWLHQQRRKKVQHPSSSANGRRPGGKNASALPAQSSPDNRHNPKKETKKAPEPPKTGKKKGASPPAETASAKNGGDPVSNGKKQASGDKAASRPAGVKSHTLPGGGQTPSKRGRSDTTGKNDGSTRWLRLIPDQPGLFLQRKFEYQLQQQGGGAQKENKTW